jgi:hypothetical protein
MTTTTHLTSSSLLFDFIAGRAHLTNNKNGPHLIPFPPNSNSGYAICDVVPSHPSTYAIPTLSGRPRVYLPTSNSNNKTTPLTNVMNASSIILVLKSNKKNKRKIASSLTNLYVSRGCVITTCTLESLKVVSVTPSSSSYVRITPFTNITFTSSSSSSPPPSLPLSSSSICLRYVHPHTRTLLSYLNLPFKSSFQSLYPRGILLSGSSGCGKTFSVFQAISLCRNDVELVRVRTYESLVSSLTTSTTTTTTKKRRIILCSHLDAICPSRTDSNFNSNRRVARVLTLLDGFLSTSTLFLATTSNPNAIDEALRRPGRLDLELKFNFPSPDERVRILKSFVVDSSSSLVDFARYRCSGYTISNLRSAADTYALTGTFPTSLRKYDSSSSSSVAGLSSVKLRLSQTIEWPLKYPNRFKHFGLSASRGLLLYGPPGIYSLTHSFTHSLTHNNNNKKAQEKHHSYDLLHNLRVQACLSCPVQICTHHMWVRASVS